jgi:methionyl-tRNA formyltransferase
VRLIFAGTPATAVPALTALLASENDVVAVITRPPAPAGRGRRLQESPVAAVAAANGIEILAPDRLQAPDFVDRLRELTPDCIPVVAYGALVPPELLDLPASGWVNLHFSLLPAWRGAAPVQHAILHGDDITGATTFRLDAGLDTGPVYGRLTEVVRPADTAGTLLERLAETGARLLVATVSGLVAGQLVAEPQTDDGVSYAPKVTSADARVRWAVPAAAVDRRIRATTPEPGAWTTFRSQRLGLEPVSAETDVGLAPGQLLVDKQSVLVGTSSHAVRLGEVRPAGKRSMAASDWARGIRPESDERFE